jgi:hypothetical protein
MRLLLNAAALRTGQRDRFSRRHESPVSHADSAQDADDDPDRDDPIYVYKPSLMSAPWEFRLEPEGLAFNVGRISGVVRYERIKRVRLSFRPVTMQSHRFLTEIWSEDFPKIPIASVSWRSIAEQARQDAPYTAFVTELHRRLAAAGSHATFTIGMPRPLFALGVVVFAGATLGLAALTVRGLQTGEWRGAAIVGGFFLLFAWQAGNYFRRNRPGSYRPDAVPPGALPRA